MTNMNEVQWKKQQNNYTKQMHADRHTNTQLTNTHTHYPAQGRRLKTHKSHITLYSFASLKHTNTHAEAS